MATTLVLASRLVLYAMLLAPWFLSVGWSYFRSDRIRRGVRYGTKPRNYADIYFPTAQMAESDHAGTNGKAPVVIAVMGGAWVIGYRVWSAVLALRLSQLGVIVVAVDYRNFPAAEMDDMVEDIGVALDWTFSNIGKCHGDLDRVLLVGQSAGAHLSAMALLERGKLLAQGGGEVPGSWSPSQLKGFFGVSGPYDLLSLQHHLASRGLPPALARMCGPDGDLARYSPLRLLNNPEYRAAAPELPPVYLFAGKLDQSVPAEGNSAFANALEEAGASKVVVELVEGLRHAEPVVEDPLTGGDMQIKLMLPALPEEIGQRLATLNPPYVQVPKPLAFLTARIMPF